MAAATSAASAASSSPAALEMRDDAALQVVAELLHAVASAEPCCWTALTDATSRQRWDSALATLATSTPLNVMVAETVVERVNAAFDADIARFQRALRQTAAAPPLTCEDVLPALETLCRSYECVYPVVQEWCLVLRVPGVAAAFAVHVRQRLLHADLLTREEPAQKRAFFAFLRRHGSELLSRGFRSGSTSAGTEADGEEEEEEEEEMQAKERGGPVGSAATPSDAVVTCLHRLTLSQSSEIKGLWRAVLETRICEQLNDLSDDFSRHFLREQMVWLERCVTPFVATVLGTCSKAAPANAEDSGTDSRVDADGAAAVRAEREEWCAEMRQLLLYRYARRRLASFWEILSDYPDSVPALEDMHYCLQASPDSGLKAELIVTVRHLLSSRLHRAGTRTEDILAIVINTIHTFCVLFPRNEQNSVVFAVVADTLEHLRKRRDCVTAIVQAVMQPHGAMNATAPPPPPPAAAAAGLPSSAGAGGFLPADAFHSADDDDDDAVDWAGGEGPLFRTAARERPDVLRVLLTSIHRRALVEEYQHVLAEQLLQKPMHDFDTTPEEEVLERLRQVFGETVLDKCGVMVRDMQMSRRLSQQLREQLARRRGGATSRTGAGTAAGPTSSVSVLSMTTWPSVAHCSSSGVSSSDAGSAAGGPPGLAAPPTYRPHPALQQEMDQLAGAYKRLKDNQRLAWLPSLGRVELELSQRDPSKKNAIVAVSHTLSLFEATVVLFVKEMTSGSGSGVGGGGGGGPGPSSLPPSSSPTAVPLRSLAAAVEVSEADLLPHVQRLSPAVLLMPSATTVAMQLSVASSTDFVFAADTAAVGEEAAKPAGLPPERVKLMERMVTSLLKTRGPQAVGSIHSSLRLLAKFEGTSADLVELLQSFVGRGLVVVNDAKLYALPPP